MKPHPWPQDRTGCPRCGAGVPPDARFCPACGYPAPRIVPGQTLNGKYEILDKIGEGGMGEEYRARHVRLDEIRIIKVTKPDAPGDGGEPRRFQPLARSSDRAEGSHGASRFGRPWFRAASAAAAGTVGGRWWVVGG